MIGGGKGAFIGGAHRIAAKIANRYELLGGVFDVDFKKAKEFAQEEDLDLNRVYPDIDSFINGEISRPADERIQVVSIVTPNFLHFEHAKKLLDNNFHVICEKPVTLTSAEALELEALVQEKQLVFCLTHTYTGYPMVREMKSRISAGAIGETQRVEAQYLQGWINPIIHGGDAKLAVWRLDPKVSGISSCMGDIGVHAFNMIEYTTGLETQAVLAVLSNLKPDNPLDLDGNVMLRFKENLTGMVMASQIATGEENNLQISIYGTKGAFHWEQENPNDVDDVPVQRTAFDRSVVARSEVPTTESPEQPEHHEHARNHVNAMKPGHEEVDAEEQMGIRGPIWVELRHGLVYGVLDVHDVAIGDSSWTFRRIGD